MQVCTSLQTDNHASTSPLGFFQAGCASCRPTNSIKALKAKKHGITQKYVVYCKPRHQNSSKQTARAEVVFTVNFSP